jgi:integrase
MPSRIFSDTWLKNLSKDPPTERTDYSEPGRKGFMLRHWPGGERTFVVRYQRNGKPRVMGLGNFPAMSLQEAHEAHAEARKLLQRDIDPIEERERQKRAQEAAEQVRKRTDAVTIRNVIAEWAWHYARRNRKHPREAVRLLKVYVATPLKGKPAADIRKRDIVLLLDRITARGSRVMANRIDALGRQAFAFAVSRDLLETSPWIGINRPGGDEQPKERKLTDDEIRAFWNGVDDATMSKPIRLALKLILTSAQRPGEIASAALSEIETKARVWTIPPEHSKNGKAHRVPLSPLALGLIDEIAEATAPKKGRERSPFLLPSVHTIRKADEPLSVRALSRALRNCIDDKGQLFGFEPFTPHDLRRTAASHMTALGIDRLHVSKVLNHTDDGITGKVYDQHDYMPEKKRALNLWADHLCATLAGKQRKVVPISKARPRP